MFNTNKLIRLDSLDTKNFTDIDTVNAASKSCFNEKQAKIYIQYWDLYGQEIRSKNAPHYNIPPQYDDAIKNVREIASKKTPWYQLPLGVIIMAVISAFFIKIFGLNG